MAESVEFVVKYRITSPLIDFGDDQVRRTAWKTAGIEHQTAMLDETFGDFVRSVHGEFELLSTEVAA